MIRLTGIVIMVAGLAWFIAPLAGVEIEQIDNIPAWAAYAGCLAGGFLTGFGRAGKSPTGTDALICTNVDCGAHILPGQRFCTACGTLSRDETLEPTRDAVLRCSNSACGKVVQPGQKFCTACGKSLE